jgi:hypothetical protein
VLGQLGLDEHDKDDGRFLIRLLDLPGSAAVLDLVAQYYPAERIPAKTRFFVEEICERAPRR